MTSDVIDRAIEAYRQDLLAEAELARADLDEIEDHLRQLAEELAVAGVPGAEAVTEAARRLGDPRLVAREHARVRTPFGARISRLRTWSAIALLSPFLAILVTRGFHLELALCVGVVAGLAARLPWARALVLGTTCTVVVADAAKIAVGARDLFTLGQLGCYAGAVAFLAPWRRGELSPVGIALAILGPAYGGAATATFLFANTDPSSRFHSGWAPIAMACVVATGWGGLMRARWAAATALLGAVALLGAARGFWLAATFDQAWILGMFASLVVGAVASALVGVMVWRHARSARGTFRQIVA